MTAADPPARLRPVERADVPGCVEVFHEAMAHLLASRGEAVPPRESGALTRLFEHLVTTDPEGAWVAEADGRAVGFALAHRRGRSWFLAFLFVLPEWQRRGVGRALMARALPPEPERSTWHLGVCAEAVQPVSTGLYARHGMVPRLPLYLLTGVLRHGPLARDPARLAATTFAALDPVAERPGTGASPGPAVLAALAAVDRDVLGADRPQDHRMWRSTGRVGLVFHRPGDAPSDAPLGYGYVQASGRIGPVLVREPSLLTPALAELTDAVRPTDGWQVIVPGPAAAALVPLLDAGLRIDGAPAVYAADWAGPPFDRYLPMNHALI